MSTRCDFLLLILLLILVRRPGLLFSLILIVSSDRSSYSDDGLLYISAAAIFQIFTQFRGAIDITSVTLREGLAK